MTSSDSDGNASTLQTSSQLLVGNTTNGAGTLLVNDGAVVISQDGAHIGGDPGTAMTVSGRGTVWENSSDDIRLGYVRTIGRLFIDNDATVQNTAGAILGRSNSSLRGRTGIVSVLGAGSRWMNQGSVVVEKAVNPLAPSRPSGN